MKALVSFLLACLISKANAQLTTPDSMPTSEGNVVIQPVFHAALVLQWKGTSVYIDP